MAAQHGRVSRNQAIRPGAVAIKGFVLIGNEIARKRALIRSVRPARAVRLRRTHDPNRGQQVRPVRPLPGARPVATGGPLASLAALSLWVGLSAIRAQSPLRADAGPRLRGDDPCRAGVGEGGTRQRRHGEAESSTGRDYDRLDARWAPMPPTLDQRGCSREACMTPGADSDGHEPVERRAVSCRRRAPAWLQRDSGSPACPLSPARCAACGRCQPEPARGVGRSGGSCRV